MKGYLPLLFKVEGKSAAVIGAGSVAKRHVLKLIKVGISDIIVYAPSLDEDFQTFVNREEVTWRKGEVQASQLFIENMLFLTTNNSELHLAIYQNRQPNQLIYMADHPELSDFHFPLTLEKGLLTIALSTGGASPSYGKQLMTEFESFLTDTIEEDLDFLAKARQQVLASGLDEQTRRNILKRTATKAFLHNRERGTLLKQLLDEHTKKST
ncbi:precorrin-2 dehydrogenase/sirohydrochlorin ferrochelatase family protein [Alkalihalobacillus deserti]|uniref:precorrin-2 dehydrogenase/sirohydrochlorin ferrochelatase family protein n=1 Tax=Alkalihalobacillus deserti TaxID=2879466 RepID=UPI001D1341AE|nr:bifunctional precorrin-2 dehydrogenase/sirohydrochlorin ferrochelatase [Alkalihalobacillus deserti]